MESERKKEIEKKRERLLQLKQAKLMRSESATSFASITGKEVEDLVNSLIGPPGEEWKSFNSLRDSSEQLFPEEPQPKPVQITRELSIESIGVFDFLPEERVMYSKEMQTDDIPVAAEAKELITEKVQVEIPAQEDVLSPVAELTETEKLNLLNSVEFTEFFEKSSKIMERALEEEYDFLIDYTQGISQEKNISGIKLYKQFQHDRWTRNRQVTDLDWSTLFPELCLGSYNKNVTNINESDGLVLVWNMHLSERPEFILHAQSDVTTAKFSPFHPSLVIGGTYSGQVLIWDTRAKNTPVLSTSLSSPGHSHPVYSMSIVGTQNAHNLVSISTDGVICTWQLDTLANPQELIEITLSPDINMADDVSVTCHAFLNSETSVLYVGSEKGNIYQVNRFERAGIKAGIDSNVSYEDHKSSVSALDPHPSMHPDFQNLILSSSFDWTIKLWNTQQYKSSSTIKPIKSFEESRDFIADVKWCPTHPSVFASVDGSGNLDLFNLINSEIPISSIQSPSERGYNKLAWDKLGNKVACGSLDGSIQIYEVGHLIKPKPDDTQNFVKIIREYQNA
ncbi:hypothetical protein HK103_003586 [Boothiomyces macroporosus]|uniref:Dynein intermediate chain n=1 Tax=Boothiomyces macroporosus TaxID=261099 RepID=A0AAD5UHR6_9FUNG|nr:hypothetical protein HK103_003586 [Boothiomyces macroporosus]